MYELLILIMLSSRDMSGYKLCQVLGGSLVPRRNISNGVMYPLLNKMAAAGYITLAHENDSPRAKKIAHITDAGRDRLQDLMSQPIEMDAKRESMFRFKLRGLGTVTPAERAQILADYKAAVDTDRASFDATYHHLTDKLASEITDKTVLAWSLRSLELSMSICDTKLAWITQCQEELQGEL
ncbi:transcriptional regulator [Secundilactobacillus paracollinoides]|uniref:PadR family transcriptional regulator n=1 Tax=Secundilactobacillus paracollinoides TaxID=240427 RepID=UPI0007050F23|nr:PadR family transcriptional regulator [Secundilactobacillus paracollinoides]ANZ65001.1 transcriptional regulator [Secundilactobacillus paracollinoides]